ncbi:SET domain-containing protein [Vararia minispora EC-137]|uniref:SET domain-containing protein n=1 Tax=Vararia minispora EC-137 TaxID=1314806 RepID=A0ACB8QZJ4_9AGAM|nr:SET domain-containing protein [Vararia minispora EC-137]
MSSFSDLRAKRKTKEVGSFLRAGGTSQFATTNDPISPIADAGSESLVPTETKSVSANSSLYRCLPLSVDIRVNLEDGRGIWAKKAFVAGDILFITKPHVHVLSTRNLELFCSSCTSSAPEGGLKRCTLCRVVWYCSTQCQNNDWSVHKKECDALQRWAAGAPSLDVAIPAEPIRCLGRLLWMKQKKKATSVWAKEIEAMQSHRTSLPPEAVEGHTHLAHAVVRYLGVNAPGELGAFGIQTAADIVDVVSRFTTNSLTLTTPSLTPLGIAVSPPFALINHSCDPNAVVVFPRASNDSRAQEPLMHVVAIRDIAPDEEIFTAYIDTTLPKPLRQIALRTAYNFECKCTLCNNEVPRDDPREAVDCPRSCGGTCPLPTEEDSPLRCIKCKAAVSTRGAIIDALRVGQEGLDKATALQISDTPKALQLTTNLLPILEGAKILPSSHPRLALMRLHQSLLLASFPVTPTQDALDNIVRTTAACVSALTAVLRAGHPIRALACAELGRLLAVDEPAPDVSRGKSVFPPSGPVRLRLAYDTLVQARSELLIGFGARNEGGEVGREVREMVVRIEKELEVWTQRMKDVMQDTPKPKGSKSLGR